MLDSVGAAVGWVAAAVVVGYIIYVAIMAITRVTHGVPGEGAFCGWGCYP
jgi:hypothetical protein